MQTATQDKGSHMGYGKCCHLPVIYYIYYTGKPLGDCLERYVGISRIVKMGTHYHSIDNYLSLKLFSNFNPFDTKGNIF